MKRYLMKWLIPIVCILASLVPVKAGDPPPARQGAFMHNVYFWLKADVSPSDKQELILLLKSLKAIDSVRSISVGTPAMTPRPVVDNSYDVALLVSFDDREGHDHYQTHQIHLDVVNKINRMIDHFVVYDALVDEMTD